MGESRDHEPNFDPDPRVFVSHHSSQVEVARHLKTALAKRRVRSWMAPDDVPPGTPFDEVITAAIDNCDAIVLLFSAAADQSRHVKRELVLADNEGIPILPMRIEAIEPVQLRYWLQTSQWIDWLDRRDEVLTRVVTQVRKLAGNEVAIPEDATAEELTEYAVQHPMNIATRRNGLIAAALAAVALIGGVGWGVWSGLQPEPQPAAQIHSENGEAVEGAVPAEEPEDPGGEYTTSGADDLIITDSMVLGEPYDEYPLDEFLTFVGRKGPVKQIYCVPHGIRAKNLASRNVLLNFAREGTEDVVTYAMAPGETRFLDMPFAGYYIATDEEYRFYRFFEAKRCTTEQEAGG